MKFINFNNKKSFTLMEIAICILIIGILLMLTIPTITKQMKKNDDYSYYLAFKTVEKLGSQIVAYGDPNTQSLSFNNNSYAINRNMNNSLKTDIFEKALNFVSPKAHAKSTIPILTWTDYEYNLASLCYQSNPDINYGNKIIKATVGENTVYYTKADAEAILANQGLNCNLYTNVNFLVQRFLPPDKYASSPTQNQTIQDFTNYTPKNYCENRIPQFAPQVRTSYYEVYPTSVSPVSKYHECQISLLDNIDLSATAATRNNPAIIGNYDVNDYCTQQGYYRATKSGDNCICKAAHTPAYNNNKVCCPDSMRTVIGDSYKFYATPDGTCFYGLIGSINIHDGSACPDNSSFSPGVRSCVCNEGYVDDGTGVANVHCVEQAGSCPRGSYFNNTLGLCISNPQIIKAKRFCQLIEQNWNISDYNCNTFTQDSSGVAFYTEVLEAVTNNSSASVQDGYLNVVAKRGAFSQTNENPITPNIVFSNGLKMWILSDKTSSIPGISFNPSDYTLENNNVCVLQENVRVKADCPKYSETDNPVDYASGKRSYFCSNEKNCYVLSTSGSEGGNIKKSAIEDARNCCTSPDLTDVINKYKDAGYLSMRISYAVPGFTVFVDINGDKGDGTLWEDVFPFYISSNGQVYPGYPLNAKADNKNLYVGGNSSALSADVYYYTVVNGQRKRINAYSSIPYARALCMAKSVSPYSPYCRNLGDQFRLNDTGAVLSRTKTVTNEEGEEVEEVDIGQSLTQFIMSEENPCHTNKCYVHLKNKIKFL